jgi:phosphoribosyl 1,2-cyclic phosphodiesterase
MKLKFYGTRGSIPVCDAGFQQFGGNTTCLQITFTDTNRVVIIDAGTGLRNRAETFAPSVTSRNESLSHSLIFTGITFKAFRSLPRLMIPGRKSRS